MRIAQARQRRLSSALFFMKKICSYHLAQSSLKFQVRLTAQSFPVKSWWSVRATATVPRWFVGPPSQWGGAKPVPGSIANRVACGEHAERQNILKKSTTRRLLPTEAPLAFEFRGCKYEPSNARTICRLYFATNFSGWLERVRQASRVLGMRKSAGYLTT